eukprot:CAMPEP_0169440550 /NCGR_PEP_ID=MMETSP1042-20121227/7794_1 /TAXON_ID=464988 /ORGANISM="Hemiselmis andersenii, Strain CCMP1180" /LENGTH=104 /DNA_ID=CAMNT_0009551543 /DNA_START=82 /DNA_END=397 /DNA_ORIENTATION=-
MASEVESFTIKPFESAEPAGRSGDEGKDETDMMCHEREQYNLMMGELVSLDERPARGPAPRSRPGAPAHGPPAPRRGPGSQLRPQARFRFRADVGGVKPRGVVG